VDPRGRSCPLAYRYQPEALAQPAALEADTLYVVGGLYGNPAALAAVLQSRLVIGSGCWAWARSSLTLRGGWQMLTADGTSSAGGG
jgi:hypothetical protein